MEIKRVRRGNVVEAELGNQIKQESRKTGK